MEQEFMRKREAVHFFLERNLLLSPDMVKNFSSSFGREEFEGLYNFITDKLKEKRENENKEGGLLFVNHDIIEAANNLEGLDFNWEDIERSRVMYEKDINRTTYLQFLESFKEDILEKYSPQGDPEGGARELGGSEGLQDKGVKVVSSYDEEIKKKEIQDFVCYFNMRYSAIKGILENRQELQQAVSINRVQGMKEKGSVALIGLVTEKSLTKNNNYIVTLEDPTGTIKVLINKNKPETYELARELVLDEVVGIAGANGDNIVFANSLILPDIPLHKEMKRSPEEEYAIFLSDMHVGSNNFLPDNFNKFLDWINQKSGNDAQKEMASKVKYILIMGDLVDGVGIYPSQNEELEIMDIYEQYNECAKLLERIPPRIQIVICPGNHDAMRLSEPQPPLYKDFAKALWELPNVTLVSNPSMVNIGATDDFPGFDILMYHGYSFDYFVANVDSIREGGGYNRADLIMKFLLQRRHLAPSHSATLYMPDINKDPLVIDKIPDFFATGHIHKAAAANYRNITMICGSCWQSKTSFQEKVGHEPEPARVPMVNLQTRQMKMLKF
ncbi:MAG: DNA-directed DNA polymerase II small subunit [Candidatus Woesearchaeota archaeon]